jgi:hypothetical protein
MRTNDLKLAPTEALEHALASADDDAYELWLSGAERAANAAELRADRVRNELARRQGIYLAVEGDLAA